MSPLFITYPLSPMSYSMTGVHGSLSTTEHNNALLSQENINLKTKLSDAKKQIDILTQQNKQAIAANYDLERQLQEKRSNTQSSMHEKTTFEFDEYENWTRIQRRLTSHFFEGKQLYNQEDFYKNRSSSNAYGQAGYEDYLQIFINKQHPEFVRQLDRICNRIPNCKKISGLTDSDMQFLYLLFDKSYDEDLFGKKFYQDMALQIFWSFFASYLLSTARVNSLENFLQKTRQSLKDCVQMKLGFQDILKDPQKAIDKTKALCEYEEQFEAAQISCHWNGQEFEMVYDLPDTFEKEDWASKKAAIKKYIATKLSGYKDWPQNFDLYFLFHPK